MRGWGHRMYGRNTVAPPGSQAINGENKSQPAASEETGLLDSNMDTRRDFIKKSAIVGAALCLPVSLPRESRAAYPDLKTLNPKRTLALWYSQTGQTSRYARLIGCILKGKGLAVDACDMQEFDKNLLPNYDLIVVGTPVFYYDAPSNVSEWLETIPSIKGEAI